MIFQDPVDLRHSLLPVRHVVNNPEIQDEVKAPSRKIKACHVALDNRGIWQGARSLPSSLNHPRVKIDADILLRAKQVVDDPGSGPLAATDLEDLVGRSC